MIVFNNVTKQYKNDTALSNVSFKIAPGEMVFLTGHSGAGKSTLLKLITAVEEPTRGKIQVNNHNLQQIKSNKIPFFRRDFGIIFQDPMLLPNRTVFENISLPLIINGYKITDIQKRVNAALHKVGLLNKASSYPLALSIGEQQRVNIARAVVNKPKILIADEPTGNLDPKLSLEIFELLGAFNAVGATVLIATHDLSLIEKMPFRTIVLNNGMIQQEVTNAA